MPIVINPANGELIVTDDPAGYYQRGYRDPTIEELEQSARADEFGGLADQAQAFAERVVRGATLGAIQSFEPGMGATPESIARGEVLQEESPVAAFAADVLPDVGIAALSGGLGGLATGAGRAAARGAVAEGAGALRAGLAAGRAGGATALAAESLGGGLVGAGQAAAAEGQYLGEDIGRDAENILFWGGLNFGLGAFALGRSAFRSSKSLSLPVDEAAGELDDVARAAELEAAAKGAPEEMIPQGSPEPHPSPADLRGKSLEDLGVRLTAEDTFKPETLEALRTGKGGRNDFAADFATTGRVNQEGQFEQGIQIEMRGGKPVLVDGRHRLMVGREKGLAEVWGQVYEGARKPGKAPIYEGPIPIGDLPPSASMTGAERRIAEREAVEDGVQRAVSNASRADAEDIVSRATIGAEPVKETDSFGRQRRLYINRDAVMAAAEREFRDDLNGAMRDLERVVRGEKQAVISAKVSNNYGAQRAIGDSIADEAAKFAGELRGEARAYAAAAGKTGLDFGIPGAKNLAKTLMDHANSVRSATDGPTLRNALDDFKRASQDIKQSLEIGAINSTEPIHHKQLIPRIDAFENRVRSALEDGAWGQAGEMQRAYNAVISDRLMPSLRMFEEGVMEKTHRGYDGTWKMEGWETKIRGFLANNDPGRRRRAAAVFDAMDELASVRRRFGDAKTAERLEAFTAKMRRTIGLADEVTDATGRMEALGDLVGGGGPMSGALAGGLMGGIPGAAIGYALPGFARQFVMGDLVRNVNRLLGASEAAAQRGVDDWIRSSRVRGAGGRRLLPKLPELSPEARQLRDVALRRGVSQSMALFMGEDESPGAAFERIRDKLLDEEGFHRSLAEEFGSLQQEAPELYMTLAGRAALARGFLIERMPPNVAVSVANPDGRPPSREAIEDWAQYVNAVRYPTRVARNLAGISVQQVETLRTIHPRFHELLQQRMLESIQRAKQTGEQLDDTFLVRAGLLFPDLDGLASPVFSREFGGVVRDFNAQQRQQQGARSAGKPGKPTPSPMLSTLEHGATFGTGF